MNIMKNFLALQLLLIIFVSFAYSQKVDSTRKVNIILNDETEMLGYIIAVTDSTITIKSLSGVISVIPKKEITETKILKGGKVIGNQYYKRDPADNHLLALPTAIPLKSREMQFNAMEVLFPYFSIGASDFLNLGVGGLPFIVSGGGTVLYYISAKVVPLNTPNASSAIGGAIAGTTSSSSILGILYGLTTFGDVMQSMTLGAFMSFSNDEVFDRPGFLLGGKIRISQSTSFLTENVMVFGNQNSEYVFLPSIGLRFSGEKLAADFGTYAYISKEDFFYPIPWIGLSYRF